MDKKDAELQALNHTLAEFFQAKMNFHAQLLMANKKIEDLEKELKAKAENSDAAAVQD